MYVGSRLKRAWKSGRRHLKSLPSSRTGENPPYGMIGGVEETSASFEARSAPRSYPTALWDGTARVVDVIWVRREWKYFWKWDRTGSIRLTRFKKSAVARKFVERVERGSPDGAKRNPGSTADYALRQSRAAFSSWSVVRLRSARSS